MTTTPHHSQWHFDWRFSETEAWEESFLSDWQRIADHPDSSVYFRPDMVRIWYETYRQFRAIRPAFLSARAGECRVVWPLVIDRAPLRRGGFWSLRPAGFNEFDYHDPLTSQPLQPDQWGTFYTAFLTEFDHRFRGRAGYLWIPRLRQFVPDSAGAPPDCVTRAPYIDLNPFDSLDHFLTTCPKQHRQDVHRQTRRLAETGALQLQVFDRSQPAAALEQLTEHLSQHRQNWPGAVQASGWHERLLRQLINPGVVDFTMLTCAGQPVSRHLGFRTASRYYYYMPTYDPQWRHFSPGKVHLALLIERALAGRIGRFDLLSGEEPYKYCWTRQDIPLYSLKHDRFPIRSMMLDWYRTRVTKRH